MWSDRFVFVTKLVLLFGVYIATARLGLSLDAVSGFATLVWPPTGIALAALIIMGPRYWPAIAAGAFLVNFITGASWPVALGIATGNTLEALLGSFLLRRTNFSASLERLKDVLGLVFFAGIISTAVSATIGVCSLLLGGSIIAQQFGETWLAWWIGDTLGALVIAPFLLVWSSRLPVRINVRQYLPVLVPFLLLVSVSVLVFYGVSWLGSRSLIFAYVIFPFLIWIVLRFRQLGCVTATFVVSLVAIWGAVVASTAHSGTTLSHMLFLLQSFVGITAVTFMIMAAVVSEREATQKRQQQLLQRAELLAKQRLRLLALNKTKDEFISLASHQLRTPATGIKQYLHMLLENYAGKLTEPQRNMLLVANEINERAIQVINNLLKVAQVDAGKVKLHLENVDLVVLISEILEGHTSTFRSRNQTVVFGPGGTFDAYVDGEKLRMVIENIIDNASKYSPPGKTLEVSLSRRPGTVAISVKDDGIGIGQKDKSKLFKKFSRIENPLSEMVGGSGLGLYWAHKIIRLHDGSIAVDSKPSQGSTFTITLPARRRSGRGKKR